MGSYALETSLTPREVIGIVWTILATTTILTTAVFVVIFRWRKGRPTLPIRVVTSLSMLATSVASLVAIQAAITTVFLNRPDPVFVHLDLLHQLLPTIVAASTVAVVSRFASKSALQIPPPNA